MPCGRLSPTIGIRLAGLGNPGSAQLCASALLFAALLAWRVAPPGGRRAAVALLTLTVVVVGAPFFGQDFGGAISAAPAYLLLGLLLYGRRITVKSVALLAAVLVGAGLIVGFIDLTRPTDKQTHVGRFFQKVADEGVSGFTTVVGRKLSLMLQTFHNTSWVLLVLGIVGSLAYLAWRTDRLRVLAVAVPVLQPMLDRARALGVALQNIEVSAPADLPGAVASFRAGDVQGVNVLSSVLLFNFHKELGPLLLAGKLPAICEWKEMAASGCLASYGTTLRELFAMQAALIDKMLKGVPPGDTPAQQPTRFELVVNLKTAAALGLTVPPSILARADEVIE